MREYRFVAMLFSLMLVGPAGGQPALSTSLDPEEPSTAGDYNLTWAGGDEGSEFELQESATASFQSPTIIYRGPDTATALTGRFDGVYHYRVRSGDGPWSAPVSVTVRHHGRAKALLFLGMGAIVFLATAALIIGGHVRHRRETHDA